MKLKIRLILRLIRSYFAETLPQNGLQMDAWLTDLLELAALPNNPSFRAAAATMIMHLPPTQSKASKQQFITALRKSVSNQLAYEVIQREKLSKTNDINEEQAVS